jgi:hypothetical protein
VRVQRGARPARERASDASLRQRVAALRDENQRLRGEVHELHTELALAYGRQRETASNAAMPSVPPAAGSAPAP